jgi:hypothetical protein
MCEVDGKVVYQLIAPKLFTSGDNRFKESSHTLPV